jgi:hypothetical protein
MRQVAALLRTSEKLRIPAVTEEEKKLTLRRIETWRHAGPELERIRRNEIRNADTQQAIKFFDGMVTEVLKTQPPRLTSGLVEQQAIFHRKRA